MSNNLEKQRTYRLTFGLIFTYFVLCLVALLFADHIPLVHAYLWNIFLALLPLVLALLIAFLHEKKAPAAITLILGFGWLIVFPNSPYMITDLAHLNLYHVSYGLNISTFHSAWFGVLFATFSIITGVLMGMLSLYIIDEIVRNKLNTAAAWIFSGLVSLLAGFGIFLGRFPRFNSWDVINRPRYLLSIMLKQLNNHTLGFVILFATMTLALYWLFYLIFNDGHKTDKI